MPVERFETKHVTIAFTKSLTAHLVSSHFCASGGGACLASGVRATRKQTGKRSIFLDLLGARRDFFTTTNNTHARCSSTLHRHPRSSTDNSASESHLHLPPSSTAARNSRRSPLPSFTLLRGPCVSEAPPNCNCTCTQSLSPPQSTTSLQPPTTTPGTQPKFQCQHTLLLHQHPAYLAAPSRLSSFHGLPPLHSLRRRLVLCFYTILTSSLNSTQSSPSMDVNQVLAGTLSPGMFSLLASALCPVMGLVR